MTAMAKLIFLEKKARIGCPVQLDTYVGRDDIHQLAVSDLMTISHEVALYTDVEHV
jgi:hypothetical protein